LFKVQNPKSHVRHLQGVFNVEKPAVKATMHGNCNKLVGQRTPFRVRF